MKIQYTETYLYLLNKRWKREQKIYMYIELTIKGDRLIDSGKIWHVFDNDLPCIIHLTGEGAPLHRLLTVRHHYLVVPYKTKTSPFIESHRRTKKIKALINIMSICLLGETIQNMLQRRTLKMATHRDQERLAVSFFTLTFDNET